MAESLKITFELEAADNPPLYQDLARFPKGPRRVNRLRTLAHAGLIAQSAPVRPQDMASTPPQQIENSALHTATLELFGPAIDS